MRKISGENQGITKPMTHVYAGCGKGKTSAALGAGLRAAGHGLKVTMIQFLKDGKSGELAALSSVANFSICSLCHETESFFWQMSNEEKTILKEKTEKAFAFAESLIAKNTCDVLILDEIFGCITNRLLPLERLINLIKNKTFELILTGHEAPAEVIELADYVSIIKCEKHPFEKGYSARCGFEY